MVHTEYGDLMADYMTKLCREKREEAIAAGSLRRCSHCKKKYVTKESLNSHIERDHIRSTCEHCGKVFNSDNYLATHLQRKHSSK